MRRVFSCTVAVVAMLTASMAFGQVPFEVFGNGGDGGLFPEEEEGWDGDLIRITHDGNGGASNGVSFDNAVKGDYSKLEFDFEFRISNEDGEGDADGIGFAYADIDLWGDEADEAENFWGGGEEPNLQGSLGIGFDTWMNSALDLPGAVDATLPNSVSLHYDGLLIVSLPMEEVELPDDFIQDQQVKRAHVEVTPDGGDGLVNLTITNVDPETGAVGETFTVFDGEPIPDFEPYDGRIVYKARTGGENSNQDVDNISITRTLPDGTREEPVVHYGRHVGGGGVGGDPCDFDGDGSLGIGDINALSAEIQAGTNNGSFDITGDGAVNATDLAALVTQSDKLNTWIGDANLDGEFNSTDFVKVFQAGLFETGNPADWENGDWNGDGVFGSSDFVAAFQDGGFELGPRAATSSVPEPNAMVLMVLGAGFLLRYRRS